MSTTAEIQAYVRANTATAYSYEGDLHALCDLAGVPAGHLLERLGALLETLPQGVLALLQNGSVEELLAPRFPAFLFAAGEQGVWYDPSDLTTMFQDAAGTVPVTGVEQPVGMIRDKSGRGNHATQSTTASRPVLSARYNLLTETEFRNGVTDAPFRGGPVTATTLSGYAGALAFGYDGVQHSYAYKSLTVSGSTTYTISVFVRMTDGNAPVFGSPVTDSEANDFCLVIRTGALAPTTYTITNLGGGLYRVSGTYTTPATPTGSLHGVVKYATNSNRTFTVTGYQLIATNDLPSNAYQRVVTATDYDSNPALFPWYLSFDGTDDWLQTGPINFTSTDKMTVVAGVRKLSDATVAILAELSTDLNTNNGSFYLTAPLSPSSANYNFTSKGTTPSLATYANASVAAPTSNVLVGLGDIGGDISRLRVDGVLAAQNTADQGTGTYGNYPLFIGRRAGTTLPFNGRLYGLIVRGAASSAAQIAAVERFMAQKTGVTL